jgi:hypothetical protein
MDELKDQIQQEIAASVNSVAQLILADIQSHVRVKSGKLRDSYGITQQASPGNLKVVIESPLDYSSKNYPEVPERVSQSGGLFVEPIALQNAITEAVNKDLGNG